jgi:hypothetical protein
MSEREIFTTYAPILRDRGLWPRPVWPGQKATRVPKWTAPDSEISPSDLDRWSTRYSDYGIGLLMGSPLPDGTVLGAIDIDRDEYVPLGKAMLGEIVCGRVGSKGVVIFVRVKGEPKSRDFTVLGAGRERWGKVAEALFAKKFCVIPPTIHPDTTKPYTWVGQSLLDVDFAALPLVEVRL